jgi:peptide/nickel transport system substrate-binding protein
VKRSTRRIGLALASTLALTLAACGGSSGKASDSSSSSGGGSQSKGGAVTVLVSAGGLSTWPNLDPIAAGTANADYRNAIFGELFHIDKNNKVQPSLALGSAISADGLTVTITLRKGVNFSDGTPLNADAVAQNINRDLLPANACQCIPTFAMVKSTVAQGDDKVVMTLATPFPPIIAAFVSTALNWMVSPTALAKAGPAAFGKTPIGAGPFTVQSNDPSQKLVLAKNTTYWQADKGLPYLDTLTFQSVGNDQAAYAGLQSNTGQFVEGITTTDILTQAKTTFDLQAVPATSVWHLVFNTLAAPMNDIKARQAIQYATDAAAINTALFGGLDKLSQSGTASGGQFYMPKVDGYKTYDLAKATDLVKQIPGGLTINLTTGSGTIQSQMAQALQSMWEKAGIKVTSIKALALPELTAAIKARSLNVHIGFDGAYDPSFNLGIGGFYSSTGANSLVQDPALDTLITQAASTEDTAKRADLYKQAYKLMSDKSYAEYLFENQTFNLASKTGLKNTQQNVRWIEWDKVSTK